MRVHHLNCATFCPAGRWLINGNGGLAERGKLVCHCLLVEGSDGLILVDTGLGLRDLEHPVGSVGTVWRALMGPRLDPEETAVRQVVRLGFRPEDVRTIVLTHLDFDHAGGLSDFPWAEVHVSHGEHRVAMRPGGPVKLRRYVPAQWAHGPRWRLHDVRGDRWEGFEAVLAVEGAEEEVLLVPLHGHSAGHCGVAVRVDGEWILHCGDAYFDRREIDPRRPAVPAGVKAYQQVYQTSPRERIHNQERLREFNRRRGREIRILCSHDPAYLEGYRAPAGVGGEAGALAVGGRIEAAVGMRPAERG